MVYIDDMAEQSGTSILFNMTATNYKEHLKATACMKIKETYVTKNGMWYCYLNKSQRRNALSRLQSFGFTVMEINWREFGLLDIFYFKNGYVPILDQAVQWAIDNHIKY